MSRLWRFIWSVFIALVVTGISAVIAGVSSPLVLSVVFTTSTTILYFADREHD